MEANIISSCSLTKQEEFKPAPARVWLIPKKAGVIGGIPLLFFTRQAVPTAGRISNTSSP